MLFLLQNLLEQKNLLNSGEIPDLKGSLFSFFIKRLSESKKLKVVFVPSSKTKKEILKKDLNCPEFPSFSLTSTFLEPHLKTKVDFFEAYYRVTIENEEIAVMNPSSMLLPLPDLSSLFITIEKGVETTPDYLAEKFALAGYINTDIVREIGEFSVRGNIVDVFPVNYEFPLRIETDFDEVNTLKLFDPFSQKSVKKEEKAVVFPVYPYKTDEQTKNSLIKALKKLFSLEQCEISLKEKVSQLESGHFKDFFYLALTLFEDTFYKQFDNSLFVFENYGEFEEKLESIKNTIEQLYENETKDGYLALPFKGVFRDLNKLKNFLEERKISVSNSDTRLVSTVPPVVPGKLNETAEFIKKELREGKKVILSSPAEFYLRKSEEFLFEYSIPFGHNIENKGVYLTLSPYSSHFSVSKLTFLSYPSLFPEKKREKKRPKFTKFFSDFSDIKKGDYVVHLDYGIGKYLGTKILEIDNTPNEMIEIEFAKNTKVYIPVSKIYLLQKYREFGTENIALSDISSKQWNKTKKRVEKEIEDYAKELLTLYAERKMAKGIKFLPSSTLYAEFEQAFPHTETEDQLNAIKDINRDLEASYPMDRLLCGDVGFGKTEVAMRACFRAVESGYQVLVLAPTTVLTFQHFERFKSRFEMFPIEIEMLSRFVSHKKQKEIIEKFKKGEIDILIGTHRILSKDIVPKNLGLIVVDEEQRFGVMQKEKIKLLRKSVNVLSMTATPIPRTLNMSVMGLKDISIIETPPKNRLAVDTYHIVFDPNTIKKAIEFELERGGQVYFVHNRIETIGQISSILKALVPKAKIEIAHGKMSEDKLEKIMLKFFNKEIDVLVCTTIIENGMDVKDANTMFINDAHNFGLSQLYQLRGRIGRSDKNAFCYLITPSKLSLTEEARKRIEALEEFSYLGAGFRISMLDLELRGAGEILGTKQSGHINSIGIELYTKLLEKAVEKLKNKKFVEIETVLEHPYSIPPDYVENSSVRLSFYRRLSATRETKELLEIKEELTDRFGKLPNRAELLIEAHKLRIEARECGIREIELKKGECVLSVADNSSVNVEALIEEVNKNPFIILTPDGKIRISTKKGLSESEFLNFILTFLKKLKTKKA